MNQLARALPLSKVALVFAMLSIPLAFARHLVSLAVVLGVLALLFALVGRLLSKRYPERFTPTSVKRMHWALLLASVGTASAVSVWMLWRTSALPLF